MTTQASIVIELEDSEECLNISTVFTDAFFKKLEYDVKVEVEIANGDASTSESGEQTGGGSGNVHEITMPYSLFYRVFSGISKVFRRKPQTVEEKPIDAKVESLTKESPDKDLSDKSTSKSWFQSQGQGTPSLFDSLKNIRDSLVTSPTKVDEKAGVMSLLTPKEDNKMLVPEETKEEEPEEEEEQEEEEDEDEEEEQEEEEDEEQEQEEPQVLTKRQRDFKSEIDKCLKLFDTKEGQQYVIRFDLHGTDIKRVESKPEYSHYMDEYRIKREIDIISEGTKRLADYSSCEQYVVDGRYIIIGPLVPKEEDQQHPEQVWSVIKNTEVYKKFVRYNII
jgi:hypothetical protein